LSYVPLFRGLVLAGLTIGLAACCTPFPQAHRPPPPPRFGPGGPPPPPRDHGDMPFPSPDIDEAIAACADELALPPPSSGDRDAPPPALSDDQRALLDACLEDRGYPPPPGEPHDIEDPV
jgi:hypothetical protein